MTTTPITFIIFGGTGDLCKQRIVPAIVKLIADKKIDGSPMVVGVGRKEFSNQEYKDYLYNSMRAKPDKKMWDGIFIQYFKANFDEDDALKEMHEFLRKIESGSVCGDRLYYFAVSYKYFEQITKQLQKYDLHSDSKCFRRVVYEKPFGHDLKSSNGIDEVIHSVFNENDVYRMDHYLAKETVQNMLVMRFANPIFERIWNKEFIDSIEIIMDEEVGAADRLEYYDSSGALRDMVQNHMLQLTSLVVMDDPISLASEDVHNKKIKALKSLDAKSKSDVVFGQYSNYNQELMKVKMIKDYEKSQTETYVKLKLFSKLKKWEGVPFILRTGKMLKRKYAQVVINFKKEPCVLYCSPFTPPNRLIINIQPVQDIIFEFNTKKPGDRYDIEKVKLEFCHECHFGPNTTETYEKLLDDAIKGDKTLFTRFDELREAWKLIDKLQKWKLEMPLKIYNKEDDDIVLK